MNLTIYVKSYVLLKVNCLSSYLLYCPLFFFFNVVLTYFNVSPVIYEAFQYNHSKFYFEKENNFFLKRIWDKCFYLNNNIPQWAKTFEYVYVFYMFIFYGNNSRVLVKIFFFNMVTTFRQLSLSSSGLNLLLVGCVCVFCVCYWGEFQFCESSGCLELVGTVWKDL